MIKYCSTRGSEEKTFGEILLNGLSSDGGLYSPLQLPDIDISPDADFKECVHSTLQAFAEDWIDADSLKSLVDNAYKDFRHADVCYIKPILTDIELLDLTTGPTLAFKDFAMQLLALLLERELETKDSNATVIGSTSGDTGSAAINALARVARVKTIMLHPSGLVSTVQRKQMTTVDEDNILNLAVNGNFDDCQHLVKSVFCDPQMYKKYNLVAVNSINFVRLIAQIAYFFSGMNKTAATDSETRFVVPTGNFGNVLSGWYAKQMGLNVGKLVVATNHNDTFHRFLNSGKLFAGKVKASLSPSMDIQIPSNLERLLWEISGRDSERIGSIQKTFLQEGQVKIEDSWMDRIRQDFVSFSSTDEEALDAIKHVYKLTGVIIDPHTAVGMNAAIRYKESGFDGNLIVLETASPAKFPNAVELALGFKTKLPSFLEDLMTRREKCEFMPNSHEKFIEQLIKFA